MYGYNPYPFYSSGSFFPGFYQLGGGGFFDGGFDNRFSPENRFFGGNKFGRFGFNKGFFGAGLGFNRRIPRIWDNPTHFRGFRGGGTPWNTIIGNNFAFSRGFHRGFRGPGNTVIFGANRAFSGGFRGGFGHGFGGRGITGFPRTGGMIGGFRGGMTGGMIGGGMRGGGGFRGGGGRR
jgi:hypothetical protein